MCPACVATAALWAAGASSAGGLTVFTVKKLRAKTGSKGHFPRPQSGEDVIGHPDNALEDGVREERHGTSSRISE